MSPNVTLSSKYNMSLGYVPLIVSILLCTFLLQQDISIYIGAAIGIIYSGIFYFVFHQRVPNFILYIITGILIVFSVPAMLIKTPWTNQFLPFFLEISVIIPLLLIYMNKRNILDYYEKKTKADAHFGSYLQGAESAMISIRVLLVFTILHFAAITLGVLITRSLNSNAMWVLLQVVPSLVFIFSIIANQVGIYLFNKAMSGTRYVPVVNEEGAVIGKVIKSDAPEYKNEITNPIIRIAAVSHGMLFLCQRSEERILDKGKMDSPMETYLLYSESIEDGVTRLLKETFPDTEGLAPKFCIKYQFKNEITSRQVYLFILDLGTDDEILCDYKFVNGKLWTFQQIEQNLDHNYFGEAFENEYDLLKTVIDTREKYKVS